MPSTITALSVLFIKALANSDCVDTFDAYLIQDVSDSFFPDLDSAVDLMTSWIDGVQATYPRSRFGYATFTDKAIPLSGFGPYGGWKDKIQFDWCYSMEQPLVNSKNDFEASLRRVGSKTGSGFDWLESQLEAMLRGAVSNTVGWDNAAGSRRIRTILMITDAASHLENDGEKNIAVYNTPRKLTSAAKMQTSGGWGSHTFSDTDLVNFYEKDRYKDMATLLAKKQYHPSGITAEQEKELQTLIEEFGPESWPLVRAHPGDDSLSCDEVDYPSGSQVAAAFKARDIIPIVLVVGGDENEHCPLGDGTLQAVQGCPFTFYKQWLALNGIEGIVRPFPNDHAQAVEAMVRAVEDLAAIRCELSTTTTTTTTEPTTTTTTTTTEPTTSTTTTTTEPTTTTTTTTTTEPKNTTTTTTSTTTEPEPTTTTTTTAEPITSSTTTTTTTTEPEPTTTITTTPEPTTTTTTTTKPTTTSTTTTTTESTTTTTTKPSTTTSTTTTTTTELATSPTTTTTTMKPTTSTSTTTTPEPTSTSTTSIMRSLAPTITEPPSTTTVTFQQTSLPLEAVSTSSSRSAESSSLVEAVPHPSNPIYASHLTVNKVTEAPPKVTEGSHEEYTSAEAYESTTTGAPGVFPAVAIGTAAAGAAALGATAIYAGTQTTVFGGGAFNAGTTAVDQSTGLIDELARETAQLVEPEAFA